jgi:hypothetical protein
MRQTCRQAACLCYSLRIITCIVIIIIIVVIVAIIIIINKPDIIIRDNEKGTRMLSNGAISGDRM